MNNPSLCLIILLLSSNRWSLLLFSWLNQLVIFKCCSVIAHCFLFCCSAASKSSMFVMYRFNLYMVSTCLYLKMILLMHEEEIDTGSKRQRGIGLGASEGPLSLDDFRSLQRSNTVTPYLQQRVLL